VDEGPGGGFVFVDSADAGELIPAEAAGAEVGAGPASGAVCASPGAGGRGE
jgi:hypothetical protein